MTEYSIELSLYYITRSKPPCHCEARSNPQNLDRTNFKEITISCSSYQRPIKEIINGKRGFFPLPLYV
ncbi:hypothetical protein ACN4EE_12135 [Geminocystis sp. CENA526]|uniref:hypothetical protein n=1 Tax=Geminocystis sp. CENA526 TaxID=1355871 RepID=UPI003D6E1E2A